MLKTNTPLPPTFELERTHLTSDFSKLLFFHKIIVCALWFSILIGIIILYRFDPETNSTFYPQCILYQKTGLLCASCGILRSTHALLHGEFLTALGLNPLWVGVLPLLLTLMILQTKNVFHNQPDLILCWILQKKSLLISTLILIVLFTILRNLS